MKLSVHLKISTNLNKIWFLHCGEKRADKSMHHILLKLQSWVCIMNLSLTFLVLFSQTNPASTALSLILKIECYLLLSSGCLSSGHTRWCVTSGCMRVAEAKTDVNSDQQEIAQVWEETFRTFLSLSRLLTLQFVWEHLLDTYLLKSQTVCKESTACTLNIVSYGAELFIWPVEDTGCALK